jgi:hypothetical protein
MVTVIRLGMIYYCFAWYEIGNASIDTVKFWNQVKADVTYGTLFLENHSEITSRQKERELARFQKAIN